MHQRTQQSLLEEEDLKELGIPLGPRKKIKKYLHQQAVGIKQTANNGLQQQSSTQQPPPTQQQPSTTCEDIRLHFNVSILFTISSPLPTYLALNGIALGSYVLFYLLSLQLIMFLLARERI